MESPTAGHKEDRLMGDTWLVLRLQVSPTVFKLEGNLSLVTAILIDGFGETCLGGSHATVTIEAH